MIKAAAQEQLPVVHPENAGIAGVTIAQLSGPPANPGAHRRNTVVVSTGKLDWSRPSSWTGALDRSPCGTGTCAKMAAMYAKGQLPLCQDFVHEGILGTTFTGRLLEEAQVGPYRAVVPSISGQAWITGFAQYVVDPEDPFPNGSPWEISGGKNEGTCGHRYRRGRRHRACHGAPLRAGWLPRRLMGRERRRGGSGRDVPKGRRHQREFGG
jgi:proline racemase